VELAAAIRDRIRDSRTVAVVAGSVLMVMLGLLGTVLYSKAQHAHSADFVTFYVSGLKFFGGQDVYGSAPFDILGPIPDNVTTPDRDMRPNLNPPFAVLLLAPLSRLPYTAAYLAWTAISFACMAAAAWLLAGAYAKPDDRFAWSLGILVLLAGYGPTWTSLSLGQTALPVLLLLAAGWRAARDDNEATAGAILGAALALKPFTSLLLVWFLARRQWRLLAWYGGSFAACNLVALAFMGPEVFPRYLAILRTVSWHGMEMNASLFGVFGRLDGGVNRLSEPQTGQFALLAGYAASVLLAGLLVLLARRLPPSFSRIGADLGYGLCLVLMLLISPLGWIYYFPILLIGVLVVFDLSRASPRPWACRTAAATAWTFTGGALFFQSHGFAIGDVYAAMLLVLALSMAFLPRPARTAAAGPTGPHHS